MAAELSSHVEQSIRILLLEDSPIDAELVVGHLSKVGLPCDIKRAAIVHDGRLDPGVQLITKPFVFSELASRLRMVLDGEAPRRTY